MRLVVFHYHDRPGGVRQVIGRGLPQLTTALDNVEEIILMMGDHTDPGWLKNLKNLLAPIPVKLVVHPAWGYAENGLSHLLAESARVFRETLTQGKEHLVWAHNLSVGRNIPLLLQMPEWCAAAGAQLWLHHHDWWWDGRWDRWQDWLASGVHDLEEALEKSVPTSPGIEHFCVNHADLPWLQIRAGPAARWVGNPCPDLLPPSPSEVAEAEAWLRKISRGRRIWLAPVRALRRKNLAEALLLARHQEFPTCLVTTGSASSAAEVASWEKICTAANQHGWPLAPSILTDNCAALEVSGGKSKPSLPALMAAADAILMPSLQEGFGLPYLEAAALQKPLLARHLPHAIDNLEHLGCTLTSTYRALPVTADSYDSAAESRHRVQLRMEWRKRLPYAAQHWLQEDSGSGTRDFGQLSLPSQLQVLEHGNRLDLPQQLPKIPHWPENARHDRWADRMTSAAPLSGMEPAPVQHSLLAEVHRRFLHWQQHPLLMDR